MSDHIKTCATCRHYYLWRDYSPETDAHRFAQCRRPDKISKVTGLPIPDEDKKCLTEREEPQWLFGKAKCGPRGNFWEPR